MRAAVQRLSRDRAGRVKYSTLCPSAGEIRLGGRPRDAGYFGCEGPVRGGESPFLCIRFLFVYRLVQRRGCCKEVTETWRRAALGAVRRGAAPQSLRCRTSGALAPTRTMSEASEMIKPSSQRPATAGSEPPRCRKPIAEANSWSTSFWRRQESGIRARPDSFHCGRDRRIWIECLCLQRSRPRQGRGRAPGGRHGSIAARRWRSAAGALRNPWSGWPTPRAIQSAALTSPGFSRRVPRTYN